MYVYIPHNKEHRAIRSSPFKPEDQIPTARNFYSFYLSALYSTSSPPPPPTPTFLLGGGEGVFFVFSYILHISVFPGPKYVRHKFLWFPE